MDAGTHQSSALWLVQLAVGRLPAKAISGGSLACRAMEPHRSLGMVRGAYSWLALLAPVTPAESSFLTDRLYACCFSTYYFSALPTSGAPLALETMRKIQSDGQGS
jgi:hypothetical protein